MGGYQASFNFNLTDVLQAQGDHIAACIDYVRRTRPPNDRRHARRRGVVGARRSSRIAARPSRNPECTPGYYNFEGEFNRRQDGNYNGGFKQYFEHQGDVRARMEENFAFG